MSAPLPPIALTCGEPAGVGPEIAAAARTILGAQVPFFWIGDPRHLPNGTPTALIDDPAQAAAVPPGTLPVLARTFPGDTTPGRPDPADAPSVVSAIAEAVEIVGSGAASALCTLPINKHALSHGANFTYPGHTEFLAALAGVKRVVMMLAADALKVVPATIHIPLARVPEELTEAGLEATIRLTHAAMTQDFGIPAPRIAVAGLNPHAGENGVIGGEEIAMITPLLDRLRAEGMAIRGPLPGDTMFHPEARARYDVAIAMYHDQALIPIKTIDFAGGVNVTLGLPFVRTSPDHGTAFDIAGTGRADPTSTVNALRMAAAMAGRRAAA